MESKITNNIFLGKKHSQGPIICEQNVLLQINSLDYIKKVE